MIIKAFTTPSVGVGAGFEVSTAMGVSYAFIIGQLCHNASFRAGVSDCPDIPQNQLTSPSGSGTVTQTGGGSQQGVPGEFKANLRNLNSDLCLAIGGDGANVVQTACDDANQKLTFTPVSGKADVFTIQFDNSGKCLDVVDWDGNGANASQYNCLKGLNQQFKLQPLSGDTYKLIAQHEKGRGRLLDVEYGSTNSNASVFTWPGNGYPSQHWRLAREL